MLYWLHQQTADFKAKYIRSMVNIAAPWGGAIKALRLMTSGDNIDVSHSTIRPRRDNLAVLGVRRFANTSSSLSTFSSVDCLRHAQCELLERRRSGCCLTAT